MKTEPVIYFRRSLAEDEEKEAAAKYFQVVERRTAVPYGSLVIPRYSALPYNEELVEDIKSRDCTLINSHREHVYIAGLRNWYYHLGELTPRTWFAMDQLPEEGPFVLKGATNSKKHQWSTHMYAKDKKEAMEVFLRLSQDGWVGVQPIYAREYIPLRQLCEPITSNSPPVCEEYRFFILDGQVIGSGFYWSTYVDDIDEEVNPSFVPESFLTTVIQLIQPHIRFWVVDVARTAEGEWIVIELNDGAQSGLSAIDPEDFYKQLAKRLHETMP